jgi:hypothetical protein
MPGRLALKTSGLRFGSSLPDRPGLTLGLLAALALFSIAIVPTLIAQSEATPDVHNTPEPMAAPTQPIPYSHKIHLALGLECLGCHTNPNAGRTMTFPETATCMKCHAAVASKKPSIEKLAQYNKSGAAVPWIRVYTLLPGVAWNHRKHLDAGVKCETCHGEVSQMSVMTNVKSLTSMDGCLDCHKLHHAKTACVTCHSAWAPGMVVAK